MSDNCPRAAASRWTQWRVLGAVCLFLATAALAAADKNPSQRDVFRAGDGIMITVPLDTDAVINGTFPIDSAGYADLPVMGRVYVNNKSVKLIEDFVSKEMAQYLRDPHLSVRPAYRLTFLGNWQRPGMHWVDAEASVWEAAKVVGGPVNAIDLDDWYIMRGYHDVSSDILADFARGSSLREAGVRSGDIFVIPIPDPTVGFWPRFKEVLTVTAQLAGTAAALATVYVTYLIYESTRPIHSVTVCGVPANTAPSTTTNTCSTTTNNQ